MDNKNDENVLNEFISYFMQNSTTLNSEFSKFVNDNFWNLI